MLLEPSRKSYSTTVFHIVHFGKMPAIQVFGHGANGMTYDWKAWDGDGYEGLLVDVYHALLGVLSR
jgi:hypothetical protein